MCPVHLSRAAPFKLIFALHKDAVCNASIWCYFTLSFQCANDTQHNDDQNKDTQHKGFICDTQHN
jgi:hypothetical protein